MAQCKVDPLAQCKVVMKPMSCKGLLIILFLDNHSRSYQSLTSTERNNHCIEQDEGTEGQKRSFDGDNGWTCIQKKNIGNQVQKDERGFFDDDMDGPAPKRRILEAEMLHRSVLNRCLPKLVRDLDFKTVSIYIQQKELLDDVTMRDISEGNRTSDNIKRLIQWIQQRGYDAYKTFKECLVLSKQENLKDMLEEEEKRVEIVNNIKFPTRRKRPESDGLRQLKSKSEQKPYIIILLSLLMTSTVTFLSAVFVLTCAVQGTYYYDSAFAANVLTAVKLALTNIAKPTEDPVQLFQLFDSGKYNEDNAALAAKTMAILKTIYTDSQLNNIVYNETLYAIFQSRGVCVVKNFDCTGQATSVYRTLDGSCNNLNHPEWGMAFRPQRRLLTPAYDGN
ncbi:hypothetical protein CHS0354_028865 [Potamilus streckersoni]|uniref:CARD domain-containing protein n=1 Tax=Potamilus streckersoni TaxID=2493646 RepID=A0AAE0VGW5_9BIVA|nr:hypothetical protein CHS0354_028865 [Potamilus streckersoni]